MRVGVTGAAGFIGSAVCRRLLELGHTVHAVDDLSTGTWKNVIDRIDAYQCDAAEADYSDDEALIHCAARADVSANWTDDAVRADVWQRGAELTRRLLESLGDWRRPFLLVSTAALYRGSQSPYAASKLASEALVEAWTEAGRIQGLVGRLVGCLGRNLWHGHAADFVRMAREGCVRALDDGSDRRSYVHVDDAADELVGLLTSGRTGPQGWPEPLTRGIWPISSGELWSWRDTVRVMRETRDFDVTWPERKSAWVGDPVGLQIVGNGKRALADGVREALVSLGWRDG